MKKNANSQQNLVVFLTGTDSENKTIKILHRKGQKQIWAKLSSLGQKPTFNAVLIDNKSFFSDLIT